MASGEEGGEADVTTVLGASCLEAADEPIIPPALGDWTVSPPLAMALILAVAWATFWALCMMSWDRMAS